LLILGQSKKYFIVQHHLSLKEAQSYIVNRQLLSGKSKYRGIEGTLAVMEQLGYVQIDTISVVARAHHHVLYTRVADYAEPMLETLEQQRAIFEYWAHAASYLPMKDFRYTLFFKEKIKAGDGHWWARDKKWMKWVYDQIKAEGPQMGKDFQKDKSLAFEHAWSFHPVSQALRQLFMEGAIMISGRKGFQKIYDLTERILPAKVDCRLPSEQEYYKYLILRDLKANGLMKAREIGHLVTIPKAIIDPLLRELVEEKVLAEIILKVPEPTTYFAIREDLIAFGKGSVQKTLKILSPFDNLLIQRKRIQELFGFEYTLECYVPEAKRKVGYFSLPLLWGTDFIGQIDLKADRKTKVLQVKNLLWETTIKDRGRLIPALEKALVDFQSFNGCSSMEGLRRFDNP
jgi:uncharacterized protein